MVVAAGCDGAAVGASATDARAASDGVADVATDPGVGVVVTELPPDLSGPIPTEAQTGALVVQLSWRAAPDAQGRSQLLPDLPDWGRTVELHVARGDWFDTRLDCFPGATDNWWAGATGTDPRLIWPEPIGAGALAAAFTMFVRFDQVPAPVLYRIGVNDWNDQGLGGEVLAAIDVYADGARIARIGEVALREGDLWDAATFTWSPELVVTPRLDLTGHRVVLPDFARVPPDRREF